MERQIVTPGDVPPVSLANLANGSQCELVLFKPVHLQNGSVSAIHKKNSRVFADGHDHAHHHHVCMSGSDGQGGPVNG